jgi:hypothetical protein
MNDRLRAMSDERLGEALGAAASSLAWPPTPDLATVVETIRDQERSQPLARPRLALPSRRRTVLLIAAAVLVLAAAAVAAKLVIDLGAITIRVIPGRPTSLSTAPAHAGDFGEPVTIERAAGIAGFDPIVPEELGPPDRVWVDRGAFTPEGEAASRMVLAWRTGPDLPQMPGTPWGAVLMQFEGEVDLAFKLVFEETGTLEEAFVEGRRAIWITGEHELDLLTDAGIRSVRVNGHVLLWSDNGFALRLETQLPVADAVRIAESSSG